jgi:hypothetical protein
MISLEIPEEVLTKQNYSQIYFDKQQTILSEYYNEIETMVEQLLSSISTLSSLFDYNEIQKWQSRSIYVFDNLGMEGLRYFLEVSSIIIYDYHYYHQQLLS